VRVAGVDYVTVADPIDAPLEQTLNPADPDS
jgi:hypothetical protein